jgi:hypothetical protein
MRLQKDAAKFEKQFDHLKFRFRFLCAFSFLALITCSCVTIKVADPKAKRATGIKFVAPLHPFESIVSEDSDEAWQNKKTGSSISFHSVCDQANDPDLDSFTSSLILGIEELKIESSKKSQFNERESLETIAIGKVDGVQVKMKLLVFKRNRCSFDLSFISLPKYYETELPVFQKFLENFRTP